MSRLDEKIGTMAYDGLIVANEPVADAFSVIIRKGAATLKRGTVLALSSRDGKFVILGTSALPATEAADAVYEKTNDTEIVQGKTYYTRTGDPGSYTYTKVAEPSAGSLSTYYEVTTPATEAADAEILTANCILADPVEVTAEADVGAIAYRTGHFNRGALILKEGTALSATDEEDLRKGGILLSDALGY